MSAPRLLLTLPASLRACPVGLVLATALILGGCAAAPAQAPGKGHLQQTPEAPKATGIPAPVLAGPVLPPPKPAARTETYSVSVRNIPAQELLFALARDARINIDVHPGITGLVTINAIDQALPQILNRLSKQVDIRWELDGQNLTVMPDKPFLRTYRIDFPNISRTVKSDISTATQIASGTTGGTASAAAGGNAASTSVQSSTKNDLMESLISNVTDMLKEEDKIRYRTIVEAEANVQANATGSGSVSSSVSSGSTKERPDGTTETVGPGGGVTGRGDQNVDSRAAATKKVGEYEPSVSVFANKETGVLIVRATNRQHEKIQLFIDQVMSAAKRQVLIEATLVEVRLSNNYKQGINWSALRHGSTGFNLVQLGSGGLASANPLNIFTLSYANPTSGLGNLAAEISLLESFGNVKVLSSPKLSVMNNQTATLKVADNRVFFTVKADTTDNNGVSRTTYTTTPSSVSVGFMMNVTPQISDTDEVTINVRPTVTRITGFVNDPNPALAASNIVNKVPEIQTREMESIIKVRSGQVAVMGGLMQDEYSNLNDTVPGVASLPLIGQLFANKNDTTTKSELVVFLRPIVIKDASMGGDFSEFRHLLPDKNFFESGNLGPEPLGAVQP